MIAELEGGNLEARDRSRQQLVLEFYREVLSALDGEFRCAQPAHSSSNPMLNFMNVLA
jgi:hypothetical protein